MSATPNMAAKCLMLMKKVLLSASDKKRETSVIEKMQLFCQQQSVFLLRVQAST